MIFGKQVRVLCRQQDLINTFVEHAPYPVIASLDQSCLVLSTSPVTRKQWSYVHAPRGTAVAVLLGIERALQVKEQNAIPATLLAITEAHLGTDALARIGRRRQQFTYLAITPEAWSKGDYFFAHQQLLDRIQMIGLPYVAQASIHDQEDLKKKIEKAQRTKGVSFINVLAPKGEHAEALCKQAVNTGFFPLLEIEEGKVKMGKQTNKLPILALLKLLPARWKQRNQLLIQQEVDRRLAFLSGR